MPSTEHGYTLIELLIAMTVTVVLVLATFTALDSSTRAQTRDQAYADEVGSTQAGFARLIHDLRQATVFSSVSPNAIQFQMTENGKTYNVAWNCAASDSLGGSYKRCAETQNVAPTAAGAPAVKVGTFDIEHVANAGISTFCNSNGTASSGSVFFVANPTLTNTDGSTATCDEAYEQEIAGLAGGPTYVQVTVDVPAGGSLTRYGMTHQTVFQTGVDLPNLESGS